MLKLKTRQRMSWMVPILVVGTLALTGISISLIYPSYDTRVDSVETFEPLPLSLQNQVPDQIVTLHAQYTTVEELEEDFSPGEIVYDSAQATADTKVIIDYGRTYVKFKDNH
ncbi:hypothetical protein [Paenibacillus massiliensis]|uniref:hypothetical protein n=1 Tax=Paenibacillus massiliensis TaxID=225917 RepID=UPI00046F9A84|nr:hypothetical protein [Paenibacillus massiliensis]